MDIHVERHFLRENQQFLHAAVASGAFASEDAAIDRAVNASTCSTGDAGAAATSAIDLPQLPAILVPQPDAL